MKKPKPKLPVKTIQSQNPLSDEKINLVKDSQEKIDRFSIIKGRLRDPM
jgi:hypothetical protein